MSARSRPRRSSPPATTWSSSTTSRPAIAPRCPPDATLHRRDVRRSRGDSPASSRPSGSRRSSTAPLARWSASRSPTRRSTTARTSPAGSHSSRRRGRQASSGWSSPRAPRSTASRTRTPIPEDAPLRPINPYGESKRTFEAALAWYGRAYGLRSVSLRYFNVAGATETLGEDHDPETHLIPNVLQRPRATATLTDLRRRLPDARRDVHPRLHPCRRPGRRPPAGDRGDRARRRAHRRRRSRSTWGMAADSRSARSSPRPRPSSGGRSRTRSGRAGPVTRRSSSRARPARRRGPRLAPGPLGPRVDDRVGVGLAPIPPGRLPGLTPQARAPGKEMPLADPV